MCVTHFVFNSFIYLLLFFVGVGGGVKPSTLENSKVQTLTNA